MRAQSKNKDEHNVDKCRVTTVQGDYTCQPASQPASQASGFLSHFPVALLLCFLLACAPARVLARLCHPSQVQLFKDSEFAAKLRALPFSEIKTGAEIVYRIPSPTPTRPCVSSTRTGTARSG